MKETMQSRDCKLKINRSPFTLRYTPGYSLYPLIKSYCSTGFKYPDSSLLFHAEHSADIRDAIQAYAEQSKAAPIKFFALSISYQEDIRLLLRSL